MAQQLNNLTNSSQDTTTSYFNNFYGPTFNVSQGVDNAAISFFEKITPDIATAKALAGALIYTAKAQNLDPIAVLQEFSTLPAGQLNTYLVTFLNLNRVGTSYLGLSNAPTTSIYISRAILP